MWPCVVEKQDEASPLGAGEMTYSSNKKLVVTSALLVVTRSLAHSGHLAIPWPLLFSCRACFRGEMVGELQRIYKDCLVEAGKGKIKNTITVLVMEDRGATHTKIAGVTSYI